MGAFGNPQPRPQEIGATGFSVVPFVNTVAGNLPSPDFAALLNGTGAEFPSYTSHEEYVRVPSQPPSATLGDVWSYAGTYVGYKGMTDATIKVEVVVLYPRYYDVGVQGPAFVTNVTGMTEAQQFLATLSTMNEVSSNAATSALSSSGVLMQPVVRNSFRRLIRELFKTPSSTFFRCVKSVTDWRKGVYKLYEPGQTIQGLLAELLANDGGLKTPGLDREYQLGFPQGYATQFAPNHAALVEDAAHRAVALMKAGGMMSAGGEMSAGGVMRGPVREDLEDASDADADHTEDQAGGSRRWCDLERVVQLVPADQRQPESRCHVCPIHFARAIRDGNGSQGRHVVLGYVWRRRSRHAGAGVEN